MRVVNTTRSDIESAERRVIEALRVWDVPGVAVCRPVGSGGSGEASLLMILPQVAVVLDVIGMKRAGDRLRCPVQGNWSVFGTDGDGGVYSQRVENPIARLRRAMNELKDTAESATGARLFVNGRVIVVPWEGYRITLDKGVDPMGDGLDVVLFDPDLSELRSWADTHAHNDVVWTDQRVTAVRRALGLAENSRDEGEGERVPDPGPIITRSPTLPATNPPWWRRMKARHRPSGRQPVRAVVAASILLGSMAVAGLVLTPDHVTPPGSGVTMTEKAVPSSMAANPTEPPAFATN
ncbi:hypothetical protein AB0N05_15905 [Nocardia sp. NPDC051030]|uniref:hypothetical protein n=1 Tax=Nocardia sp. NPDC051030 TaxID=3155162 RepID=UPI00342A4DC4